MKRIILLIAIGGVTLGGWALAQQDELLDHLQDVHMQKMQDASCSAPSSSPGGQ